MFLYKATPTSQAFHESDAYIKAITGPFASGKSTAVAEDLLIYAIAQEPSPDGVRYSRWGVIRGSYPALISATRNTLLEVMPAGSGSITGAGAPLHGVFKFNLNDGTSVQMEFQMISAASEADADKFRSVNWTGCWINEATEISAEVVAYAAGRIGRFPTPGAQQVQCSWAGLLMDFNRPPVGHFLDNLMKNPVLTLGDELISVSIFEQPPAAFKRESEQGVVSYELNPAAENLENLKGGVSFYNGQIAMHLQNNRPDLVDRMFCLLDAPVRDGKAVFPQFKPELHVAKAIPEPVAYARTIVGYDTSGIHPAAVVLQLDQGKWQVLDELIGEDMGLEAFVESALGPLLRSRYSNCEILISVDPANAKDSYTGLSPVSHLKRLGFRVYMPLTNSPEARIRAVERLLNLHTGGLVISPRCQKLIEAMNGGYRYRKLKISGTVENLYAPKPEKNEASHPADALQYAALCILRQEDRAKSQTLPITRKIQASHALRRRII